MFKSYDYRCECGAHMEDYLHDSRDGEVPESFQCPRCDLRLVRVHLYANRTLGPVWSNLEDWDNRLFSAKQRRMGMQVKSNKDIQAWEDERGLYRPSETEAHVMQEESLHDGAIIKKIAREDGSRAAEEYVDTTEIMGATGWTKQETERWKEQQNAPIARVDPSAFESSP